MKKYSVTGLWKGLYRTNKGLVTEHWEYCGIRKVNDYMDIVNEQKENPVIIGLRIKDCETKQIVWEGRWA